MKKQLMIALLSIVPALGVVAQDKLYKDEFLLVRYPKNASHFVWCEAFFRMY